LVPVEDRLWAKVNRQGIDDCWEWTGYRNVKGYGQIKLSDGKVDRTHRVALRSTGVKVGFGDVVMHKCDNPPCCNPSHLSVGTIEGNTADMVAKNRHSSAKGSKSANSKLTEKQVREIRDRYSDRKTSTKKISDIYGVSQPTISYILIGKIWKGV
jgi:HNH endonuclease